jgi:hypothetical protein
MPEESCLKKNDGICSLLKLVFTLSPPEQVASLPLLLNSDIDWEKSFYFLARKKLALAAWSILKAFGIAALGKPDIFKKIKTEYLVSSVFNCQYREEAEIILRLFQQGSLDVIVLKGYFLSQTLYQDIAVRGIGADTDLLIKEKDRLKARKILESAGYKFCPSDEPEELAWSDSYSKDNFPPIDLHWDITMGGRNPGRIAGFWRNAQLVDKKGISYYEFMPEELLLYLAANFSNSEISKQLKYLCDSLRLISLFGDRIEWDQLICKAKQWKLSGPLYAVLHLAIDLGLRNFPESVLKKISLPVSSRFFINILVNKRHIFNPGLFSCIIDRFFANFLFEFIISENFHDYIIFFKRLFYPSLNFNQFTSVFKRIAMGIFKICKYNCEL